MTTGPTTTRVNAICDHLRSLGAYTQAHEIERLCLERNELKQKVEELKIDLDWIHQ
jgi:hypothetical protein